MIFDFELFKNRTKLAYRNVKDSPYSFNDVLSVFNYYFETYELIKEEAHPMISISQIESIIEVMPYLLDKSGTVLDIDPDTYEALINQHFGTKYRQCDYNINHFFSGVIRYMRYFETCY